MTGTRQAAAHVAGAISLIYEAARVNDRVVTWEEVKEAILEGADQITGGRRLNIVGALKHLDLYDRPPVDKVRISLSGGTVTEGDFGTAAATFTVTLGTAFTAPITVQCLVADGSATLADKDYQPVGVNGLVNLTIPAGQKSATLVVPVVGDHRIEPNETIKASLVDLAETFEVTTGSAEVTIIDDDPVPRVSLTGPVSVVEGTGGRWLARVFATLSEPSSSVVSASVRTVAGSATEGVDYRLAAATQRVVFAPGQTTQAVSLIIIGDAVVESHEMLEVQLAGPINATLGPTPTAVVTIVDDDAPFIAGMPSVRRALVGAATTMSFTISLSRPAAAPVSVGYSALDGTAVNGVDFTLAPGTLVFAPGERVKTITVVLAARRAATYPRLFTLRLADALGGVFAGGVMAADLRGSIV